MAGFLKKISDKTVSFFKNMTKGQRVRLISLVCVVIVLLIAVSVFLSQKNYTVLYTGMDPADAGEVMEVLAEMNVDAKARGSDTVLVPTEQADEIRMSLAAQGYPNSGYNYDIYANATGLGATDMERKVYYQFQLQENLRQTIRKLDKVEDAVVNISLADDSAFVLSNNYKEASAAVMLTLKAGQKLSTSEVRAIAELVSTSVSGLKVENVRIVDSKMTLYSIEDDTETGIVGSQLELQNTVQKKLQQQVINLLKPVFGEDGVLAEVNVSLNFDSQISESVVFTPPIEGSEEGIAVSIKELAETVHNKDGASGAAGLDSQSGADTYPAVNGDDDTIYKKVSTEANYEINQTKTQIEKAKGKVEDLSVSVILNSADAVTKDNDYRDSVRRLVATAIGVLPEMITVEMLPFKQPDTTSAADVINTQKELLGAVVNAETVRIIIIAAAALLVMLIIFLIIRTVRRPAELQYAYAGVDGIDVMVGDEEAPAIAEKEVVPEFEIKEKSNLEQLEKYIDKDPEAVAQLLRNWLSD